MHTTSAPSARPCRRQVKLGALRGGPAPETTSTTVSARRITSDRLDELVARGIHAPVRILSDGAPGAIVIAPGDVRGTVLIPEKCGGYCCGPDGADRPNMACEACGLPVASRTDDCSLWQAVWLAPDAVRRRPVDDADAGPLSWAELVAEGRSTPPFEPITARGGRRLPAGRSPIPWRRRRAGR